MVQQTADTARPLAIWHARADCNRTPPGQVRRDLGGEEFAVLLPGNGPVTARLVAGRLRAALDQSGDLRYTVSIGLASLAAGASPSALLKRADAAL